MSFLSNFISPKLGIKMIRGHLEKQFNKKIKFFTLVYNQQFNALTIIIDGITYVYESDELKSLIVKYVSKNLKKEQQLNFITCAVNEKDEINVSLLYSENNEKKKVTYKL